jgi:uncharacterized phiE125 gp8 family phage protein
MSTTYKVTTEPTSEPVSLSEFKDALRVSGNDFDIELSQLLKEARQCVENDSMRKLVTQTVTMYMDEFPDMDEIEFRLWPITSVSSVKYYDGDGTLQTLSTDYYWTNLIEVPPEITLKSGFWWPLTQLDRPNSVEIVLVCGSAVASVDVTAKLAIKERGKLLWSGCDGSEMNYQRLISRLMWTGYKAAQP